jgi:antitoxin component HigA of HigAB toxin-antitoxin module
MKGIELLPFLSNEQKELLETSAQNYKRFARVYFQILEFSSNTAVVKVWQLDNHAEHYLTAKELIERTKEVFGKDVLPAEIRLHVRPIAFKKDELKALTVETIEEKMLQFGLKAKDLVKLLDIDKSSLSQLLSKKRELSRSSKAMFYYLFKSLETQPYRMAN